MHSLSYRLCGSLGLLLLSTTPAFAASAVPTCEAMGRAISSAHDTVTSVEDNTPDVQKDASLGTTPFPVLRACEFQVAGRKWPFHVTIYDHMDRKFIDGMMQFALEHGGHPKKLEGSAYGDAAAIAPQGHSGYGVEAVVQNVGFVLMAWTDAESTKDMAAKIVKLL